MIHKLKIINDLFLTIFFILTALSGYLINLRQYHKTLSIICIIFVVLHFIAHWSIIKYSPRILNS